jgi:hypothetical protein
MNIDLSLFKNSKERRDRKGVVARKRARDSSRQPMVVVSIPLPVWPCFPSTRRAVLPPNLVCGAHITHLLALAGKTVLWASVFAQMV